MYCINETNVIENCYTFISLCQEYKYSFNLTDMKKILVTFSFLLAFVSIHQTAQAQWGVGASYEIRNEDPENGFGFRLERSFLQGAPLIDLGIRAHFSYFNDEITVSRDDFEASTDIDVYDYGLAALAGIKLGIVKPYVGLGIGNQQFKFDPADNFNDSSFYWNGFGGAEVIIFPFLQPFIEYRIANLTSTDDIDFDNVSRLAIGLNIRF